MPTILYNASTGNDTHGGTNTPSTAITDVTSGITISTATSTTQTFSAAVDLTGVADDGTDVIRIGTPTTNRHLFTIVSYTGGVAACTAIVTNETATGTGGTLAWGIGGVRQTIDVDTGRPDIEDYAAGWIMELQAGTYAVADASTPMIPSGGDMTSGPIIIRAASGATPTISWTSTANSLFVPAATTMLHVQGDTASSRMSVTNTTASATTVRAFACTNVDQYLTVENLTIQTSGGCVYSSSFVQHIKVLSCDIRTTGATPAVDAGTSRPFLAVLHSTIHNCGGDGVYISPANLCGFDVVGCVIFDCAANGILIDHTGGGLVDFSIAILNNTIHGCTGDGIDFNNTTMGIDAGPFYVINNLLTDNGGYGGTANSSSYNDHNILWRNNAFRGNTSGQTNNIANVGAVTLSADPYTNEAGDDYTLNNTAGGGAACRDAGLGYGA